MYLSLDSFDTSWRTLCQQSVSQSTCKVALLVANFDVDAMCAAKMLCQTFKRQLIFYKAIPVSGLDSLQKEFDNLDEEILNVILVGCGASFDLEELVGDALKGRTVHIMDNHRPWNLENLYGSEKILCYDDGSLEDLQEYQDAWTFLNDNPEPEEDDDDDDLEDQRSKRQRVTAAETVYSYMQQGTYLYSTTTVQVYTLLTMIGQTSKRNLWLMIIGVCSVESRAPEVYMSLFPIIKDEITRLGGAKEHMSSNEIHLKVEMDFSLFLLRSWSLFESMMHSSYLSSKFKLYNDAGRKKMHEMLAQIGVPLTEARENWLHMNQQIKGDLKDKFSQTSEMYDIQGVLREGVVRQFGWLGGVSANDCAQSVAALLEGSNPSIENFWDAWTATEDFDALKRGTERAKMLQRVVVSTSNAVFEKNQPKNLVSYRLAVVQDGPDLETLANPLTLLRLGTWIADGCSEMASYSYQPLVVACYNELEERYLVLGLAPRKRRDDVSGDQGPQKNRFGVAFREVSAEINAKAEIEGFDEAVVRVKKDDLGRFLERLAEVSE